MDAAFVLFIAKPFYIQCMVCLFILVTFAKKKCNYKNHALDKCNKECSVFLRNYVLIALLSVLFVVKTISEFIFKHDWGVVLY